MARLLVSYNYLYGYDPGSNRTTETIGPTTTTSAPNDVNEITSQSGGTNRTLSYDANGSLTSDGSTRTFEWDGANRLVAINYTGTTNRSEFTYDGLNRCAKIVEKTNGAVTSTRKFVWSGNDMCEFRDANDAVTLFVYRQGQHTGTTKYFYSRDHLGSIREMVSNSGVVARYDYDAWGRSTAVINTTLPDFNFTGLYRHSASNLDMAVRRFYDPNLGRWLSRDPIGEQGGINLYGYVANSPTVLTDPTGLLFEDLFLLLHQINCITSTGSLGVSIRSEFYARHGDAFNNALRELTGYVLDYPLQTFYNSPEVNTDYNETQLGQMFPRVDWPWPSGENDPFQGPFGVVYIATESLSNPDPLFVDRTYAHELTNILDARIYGRDSQFESHFGLPSNPPSGDYDSGMALELLLFGPRH
jgi:RHS repeat-associated protein